MSQHVPLAVPGGSTEVLPKPPPLAPDSDSALDWWSNDVGSVFPSPNPVTGQEREIEKFLDFSPPSLMKDEDHTKSKKTRPPAFYDKHLDRDLILKRVRYCPEITSALAAVADDAVRRCREAGKLPPTDTSSGFPSEETRRITYRNIKAPILAEESVVRYYGESTAKFCSTVVPALHLQLPSCSNPLLEWTHTDKNRTEAVADGFLRVNPDPHLADITSSSVAESMQRIAKTFPVVAIWEFKNMAAGSLEVMNAIVALAEGDGSFDWEACEHGDRCIYEHVSENGRQVVTGHRTGPDAKDPPIHATHSAREKQDSTPETKLNGKSARHIAQQIWAECVMNDTTYVVVHSGNFEIIAMRIRAENVLYLSSVIKVSLNPGYGKLQTGLWIASLLDAEDRTTLVYDNDVELPDSWYKSYDNDAEAEALLLEKMTPEERKEWKKSIQAMIREESAVRNILTLTAGPRIASRNLHFLVNTPYFRNPENYPSPCTNPFPFLNIIVNSTASDPRVYKGSIRIDGKTLNKAVIVKCAATKEDIVKLQSEFQAYLTLSKRVHKGISKVLGFFKETTRADSLYGALIMEYEGSPFDITPATDAHKEQYKSILRNIHTAGLVHGKLRARNLLTQGKKATIVGFGAACMSTVRKRKSELRRLERILYPSETRRCRPRACAIRMGAFKIDIINPAKKFDTVTKWMRGLLIPDTIRITCGRLPDWLDVDFRDVDGRKAFFDMWNSDQRPAKYHHINCFKEPGDTDTDVFDDADLTTTDEGESQSQGI